MDIHWRNSQKPVRFFFLDARAFVGFLFYLVHARIWTLALVFIIVFVFWIFERKGLTFESAIRATRSWLVGEVRPGTGRRARRRWVDYEKTPDWALLKTVSVSPSKGVKSTVGTKKQAESKLNKK